MPTRSFGTALVTMLLLVPAAPASAQQAKCLAGKTGCMAKKAAGLLKCEALAETPGRPADPNAKDCVTKAQTRFDGGLDPAKGCFEKLESKVPNDCPTVDNTGAAETAVDACVAALVVAIDPPPPDQTKCGASKKKCASKYLSALLKCRKLAQTPGKPTDPNAKGCVDKAVAKYTGGDEPARGCFAKVEARAPNDCQSTTDSPTVKALVEDCVDDLVAVVVTTTTSTTSTTTTTTTTTTLACSPVDCNDNNACTDETCAPGVGCIYMVVDCNDNNACTDDSCDSDIGCIHTELDCNDENVCTDDTCDPAIGCIHTEDCNACPPCD